MPFYFAEINDISEESILLTGAEHKHLSKVMRAKKGDTVTVTDGAGMTYSCFIAKLGRNEAELNVIHRNRNTGEPSRSVTLAIALSTSGKFDTVLQMCCEIGVTAIVPLLTEKSKVKLETPERVKRKLTRWRDVLKAAVKQSERSRIPDISAPQEFASYLDKAKEFAGARVIAHPDAQVAESRQAELALTDHNQPLLALLGSESGFSENEFTLACQRGFLPLNLGPRILRAETAAPTLAALALLPER
jgi:16S rRNA (uracil1498-N3)-methyltransferase